MEQGKAREIVIALVPSTCLFVKSNLVSWIINNYYKIMSDFWTMVYSLSLYLGTPWILFLLAPTDYSTLSPEYWSGAMLSNPIAFCKLSICSLLFQKRFGFICSEMEMDLFWPILLIWVLNICIHLQMSKFINFYYMHY